MSVLGDAASGRWPGILTALGVPARILNHKNQSCLMCGGKDRFRFTDFQKKGGWICNECGHGDGFELLKRLKGIEYPEAARMVEEVVGKVEPDKRPVQSLVQKRKAAADLWASGGPVRGPVAEYLIGRGINPPWPDNLRAVDGPEGWMMLARVQDPSGKGISVHRTWISPKRRKMMPGELPAGSAIRLAPVKSEMGIAEGIETAIRAGRMLGIPTWAAISADQMAVWKPPEGIEKLYIFGDNDLNFHGQHKAYECARAAHKMGIKVEVWIPEEAGTDWADGPMAGLGSR